jgi:hypothetical protein
MMNYCIDCRVPMGNGKCVPVRCPPCAEKHRARPTEPHPPRPPGGVTTTDWSIP